MESSVAQEWVEYLQKVTEDQIEKPHLWLASEYCDSCDFWCIHLDFFLNNITIYNRFSAFFSMFLLFLLVSFFCITMLYSCLRSLVGRMSGMYDYIQSSPERPLRQKNTNGLRILAASSRCFFLRRNMWMTNNGFRDFLAPWHRFFGFGLLGQFPLWILVASLFAISDTQYVFSDAARAFLFQAASTTHRWGTWYRSLQPKRDR